MPPDTPQTMMPVFGILGLVAFLALVLVFVVRRGRALEWKIPTDNPGPGGVLGDPVEPEPMPPLGLAEGERRAIEREVRSMRDTDPAPPKHHLCRACQDPGANRAMPRSVRAQRMAGLANGVELDVHGDRLYGQPRAEEIERAGGTDLCPQCELVAFRLVESFHARQRSALTALLADQATEAATFEGAGLLRKVRQARQDAG